MGMQFKFEAIFTFVVDDHEDFPLLSVLLRGASRWQLIRFPSFFLSVSSGGVWSFIDSKDWHLSGVNSVISLRTGQRQ